MSNLTATCVKQWHCKREINRVVAMLMDNTLEAVLDMRRAALAKATSVMLEALDDRDVRVRMVAAIDITDRAEGKPVQRIAPTNPQGTESYNPGTSVEMDERIVARLEEIARNARQRRLLSQEQAAAHITVVDTTTTPAEVPIEEPTPMPIEQE